MFKVNECVAEGGDDDGPEEQERHKRWELVLFVNSFGARIDH